MGRGKRSEISAVREHALDALLVDVGHHGVLAQLAAAVGRLAEHHVAESGAATAHPAAAGDLEALLRAAVRLHLRHGAVLVCGARLTFARRTKLSPERMGTRVVWVDLSKVKARGPSRA